MPVQVIDLHVPCIDCIICGASDVSRWELAVHEGEIVPDDYEGRMGRGSVLRAMLPSVAGRDDPAVDEFCGGEEGDSRNMKSAIDKIIGMFRPHDGRFLNFKSTDVICGPDDRAVMGFSTNFPKKWLVEDFGFTTAEAEWFIKRVRELAKAET